MTPEPKEACINCQLLVFYRQGQSISLDSKQRELVRVRNLDFLSLNNPIGCHGGIWVATNHAGEGLPLNGDVVHGQAIATERKGKCYYWPRTPGLEPATALVLHQQQAERKKATADRRLTIAVALGSIAVTALCQLLTAVLQLQAVNELASAYFRPWLPP